MEEQFKDMHPEDATGWLEDKRLEKIETTYITIEEIMDKYGDYLTYLDYLKLCTFRKIIHVKRVKE